MAFLRRRQEMLRNLLVLRRQLGSPELGRKRLLKEAEEVVTLLHIHREFPFLESETIRLLEVKLRALDRRLWT